MLVKCPQCATGYRIPEEMLSAHPRKMRCTKCTNTFVVTRRSEHPPSGYMEFTGSQQLPPEFAFLRSTAESAPSDSSLPQTTPPQSDADETHAVSSSSAAEEHLRGLSETDLTATQRESVSAEGSSAVLPAQRGGSVPVGNSVPAETLFGSNSSAWEVESPLELGSYAMDHETQANPHIAGKVVFGLLVTVFGLLLFVSARNNWEFSIARLPEQFAAAFSGEAVEALPREVRNIDVTVLSRKIIRSREGHTYLLVSGEVLNNNPVPRTRILLRGTLYDDRGNRREEVRLPCGRTLDEKVIRRTSPADLQSLFITDGGMYNCQLPPRSGSVFQLVFGAVPDDYRATFDVRVQAVAAIGK